MTAEIHDITGRNREVAPAAIGLPISIEAEQAVLGTLLMSNASLGPIASNCSLEDFSEPIHAAIFDVASGLIGDGKVASPGTLKPFLGEYDLADGVTVQIYLARLCAQAMPAVMAPGYAQIVRSLAVRRRLITVAEDLNDRARSADVRDDPASIAASFMQDLQGIAASAGTDTARHISEEADDLMCLVEGVRSGEIEHRLVTTGYRDIDEATSGFDPGTLWISAGRPGMGKTILANSTGYRTARAGTGVLEFPLEIGPSQMVARHLADIAYRGSTLGSVAFRDIGRRAKALTDTDILTIRNAHAVLRDLPIEIDNRSRVTLPQIAAKVAQTKRAMLARGITLGLVTIDHLDFIHASDRYRGNRVQEIGEIAIGLKDIARSQNVCINLMCQLSREVEKRDSKSRRPGLSDLRNSGDLEQVADVVMFLYREEYYLTRSPEYLAGDADAMNAALDARGKLEAILGKVRAGPTPTVHLFCDPASSSISSFDRRRA